MGDKNMSKIKVKPQGGAASNRQTELVILKMVVLPEPDLGSTKLEVPRKKLFRVSQICLCPVQFSAFKILQVVLLNLMSEFIVKKVKLLMIRNTFRKHEKGLNLASFSNMDGQTKGLALTSPASTGLAKIRSRL